MAIVTSHTIHVAILPTSSYELDIGPLKLKTFQLGPTEHILESSPVVSVLWHPLGPLGHTLVTITQDAVVRLWEVSEKDRWSFDKCPLSIDLKKLANADHAEQNIKASKFGYSKGFSPDAVDLEPAAASFGGLGRRGESPWASMTLWIATTGADLYALSPLLPSKWQAYPGQMQALTDEMDLKRLLSQEADETLDSETLHRQTAWVAEFYDQEPFIVSLPSGAERREVYTLPRHPEEVPRLQGPFDFDNDDIENVSDLVVRNIPIGDDPLELETGEVLEDEDEEIDPVGATAIFILSQPGTVRILLDLDGIEGQWLPSKTPHSTPKKQPPSKNDFQDDHILFPFETISVLPRPTEDADFEDLYPAFTIDAQSPFAFWITHEQGVSYLSADSWIEMLRQELDDPAETGVDFRLASLSGSAVEHTTKFDPDQLPDSSPLIPASIVISDTDLGYLVITSINRQPRAVVLDAHIRDPLRLSTTSDHAFSPNEALPPLLMPAESREAYQPDNRFHQPSQIPAFLKTLNRRSNFSTRDQVRLTGATLNLFLEVHRVFRAECQQVGDAAARLYRAVGRLQNEYHDQIQKLRELISRVEDLAGVIEESYEEGDSKNGLEARLGKAKAKQADLQNRYKQIQKKLNRLNERQMSDREKAFAVELKDHAKQLDDTTESREKGRLWRRLDEMRQLVQELSTELQKIPQANAQDANDKRLPVPTGFRKERLRQVDDLLAREDAMVESAADRLQRLSVLSS
jgi:nucleoporin NUP82